MADANTHQEPVHCEGIMLHRSIFLALR